MQEYDARDFETRMLDLDLRIYHGTISDLTKRLLRASPEADEARLCRMVAHLRMAVHSLENYRKELTQNDHVSSVPESIPPRVCHM